MICARRDPIEQRPFSGPFTVRNDCLQRRDESGKPLRIAARPVSSE